MQFSYSYWQSCALLVKSMGTHWENKVTLVKKLNVPINLVYGVLKTGDLKTISLTLPIGHGVDLCNIKC